MVAPVEPPIRKPMPMKSAVIAASSMAVFIVFIVRLSEKGGGSIRRLMWLI